MKYKELKKLLYKTQMQLAHANKTVHDLMQFNNMQERIQIMSDKEIDKRGIIIDYLEDRQTKLIQAMSE